MDVFLCEKAGHIVYGLIQDQAQLLPYQDIVKLILTLEERFVKI
jgi:hypothetical protein